MEFNQTKQAFQDALENAGYRYTLKWKENDSIRPRRKLRKKKYVTTTHHTVNPLEPI